jgi:hypothetical protein
MGIPYSGQNKMKLKMLILPSWNARTLPDIKSTSQPLVRRVVVIPGAGVGFAIKTTLVPMLASLPEGLNDRLMKMQLPLRHKANATLISAYARTMTNPDEIKDKFYEELDSLISSVPQSEKLIVLGYFNARVGTDHQAWQNVIGKHRVGKCNSNGLLLLRLCASHGLAITNTMFHLPTCNKTSWMHPRSRHWHLIDYVITRVKDRQDVQLTKSMCGADCWTDHHLIIYKLNFPGAKVPKKLNTTKLKCPQKSEL